MEHHAAFFAADGHEVTVLSGAELRGSDFAPRLASQHIVFAHNLLTMPFDLSLTRQLWDLAERLPQVRFVAWVHDVAAANADYTIPAGSEGDALRSCSPHFEYVAVSERRKCQLQETMGVPPERCRVIPNGIAPLDHWQIRPAWRAIVEQARLLERDLVLLHPARLVRRKNIELSLRVTAALRGDGCDAALLVTAPEDPHNAAGAAYAAELRALQKELRLENDALFLSDLGPLTGEDIAGFYRLADAVFFPSRQEGFGLPLLEAALHRLPIFCPALEPLTSILPGAATYFDPGATPEQIAAILRRQLAASPAIQARRQAVRAYAWPSVYRNFIAPLLAARKTQLLP